MVSTAVVPTQVGNRRPTVLDGSKWIAYRTPNPNAQLRLFCFAYAGGGASIYRSWANVLPSTVEVYPVQLPGREGRISEQPFTDVNILSAALIDALLPYLDRPFAFFGHSLGARINFDLTRALRHQQAPLPTQLFVSGCRAPQVVDPDPPIHRLPDDAFIRELRAYNGTPAAVLENEELMTLMLPIVRNDFALSEQWRYHEEPPLPVPIAAYGGLKDLKIPRTHVAAWAQQTSGAFTLRMFPGDHFFLHSDRQMLMDVLCRDLLAVVQRL